MTAEKTIYSKFKLGNLSSRKCVGNVWAEQKQSKIALFIDQSKFLLKSSKSIFQQSNLSFEILHIWTQ